MEEGSRLEELKVAVFGMLVDSGRIDAISLLYCMQLLSCVDEVNLPRVVLKQKGRLQLHGEFVDLPCLAHSHFLG